MSFTRTSLAMGAGLTLLINSAVVQAAERPTVPASFSGQETLTADAFTTAVLARNAGLTAMEAAVVAAVASIEPAGSLDDPMLSIAAAPVTFGNDLGGRGEVQVSQALPWWGTLDAREEAARAQAQAVRHDLEGLQLQLTAMARNAFADWVFVHRALDVNAANGAVLADLRSIAKVRYATGKAAQGDVLQAQVEQALLKQQVLDLKRQRTSVQARMNALLNQLPDTALPPPTERQATFDLPPQEILAERALAAHPQLRELAALREAAEAEVRVKEKARYPQFRVTAGYNTLWENRDLRPLLGVSINVPLNQGKYQAAIAAARAGARRAASTLEDQRATVLADLASAYAAVHEAAQSLALYEEELVPLARDTLQVAETDYGAGQGDFLDVLTAERRRLDVELGLAHMQAEYFRRRAGLERASGGLLEMRGPSTGASAISGVNHD